MQPSITPAAAAFRQQWREAELVHILDDSLARDVAQTGIDSSMVDRFLALARYARDGAKCDGLLFTCSAFGSAIEAAKEQVQGPGFPVLKPNEAMMEDAVGRARSPGPHRNGRPRLIAVLSMFEPTLPSIVRELGDLGGGDVRLMPRFVPGALEALREGDEAGCVERIAEATGDLVQDVRRGEGADGEEPACVVLAMFSMARARAAVEARLASLSAHPPPVLTSPDSAVQRMRALLGG